MRCNRIEPMDKQRRNELQQASKVLLEQASEWGQSTVDPPLGLSATRVTAGRYSNDPGTRRAWEKIAELQKEYARGTMWKGSLVQRARTQGEQWKREATAPPGGTLTAQEEERIAAIEKEEALRLDPNLSKQLRLIETTVLDLFPPSDIVMGGGSVLEARYQHRKSFDIDLFYEALEWDSLYDQFGDDLWKKALGEYWEPDRDPEGRITRAARGWIGDTETTLFPLTAIRIERGKVAIRGSRIKAQSTVQILEGKIEGRLLRNDQDNTIRDLYDITVAARIEPAAVREVLQRLHRWPGGPQEAEQSLAQTPHDLYKLDPRPISVPSYEIELEGLAEALIPLVRSADPMDAPKAVPLGRTRKKGESR